MLNKLSNARIVVVQKILNKLNSSVGGGAILIAFFSIISKLLGLVRDRLLAVEFGASRSTDIYFASFKLPDLIFNIFVLGALTSAFIPVFVKVWSKDEREGMALSNTVLNILLIVVGLAAVMLFFAAPWFVPWLVPGFAGDDVAVTVQMTRVVLISLVFFTASNVISGVLNAWKRFFTFSLSSVVYNLGIIAGILWLYPLLGIYGLAWGVVIGSVMHLLVQVIEAWRCGWRYRGVLFINGQVKKIFSLMIPRTIGLAASQIEALVTTVIASTLAAGSLAVITYANNLQSFPIGIFGISLAVAAFPSFSKSLAEQNTSEFRRIFSVQVRRILFFLIPISFTMLLLRAQIIRVVLGSGEFDWTATRLTAQALGYYSLSICAQGLIPLLARSFYALEDTKTPVVVSIFCTLLNIVGAVVFGQLFGVLGIVAVFSTVSVVNMGLLFYLLHRRMGNLDDTVIIKSISRILTVSLVAASITYLSLQVTSYILPTRTFIGIFTQGLVSGSMGLLTFGLLSFLLNFEEIEVVRRYLSKFLRPIYNAVKQSRPYS